MLRKKCCYLTENQHPHPGIKTSVFDHSIRDYTPHNNAHRTANQWDPGHPVTKVYVGIILVKVRLSIVCPDISTSVPY
jgi:hypothetical protein